MPLVPMKEMLIDAMRGRYAVGAFDIMGIPSIKGVIEAAEETNSPVILMFAEMFEKFHPMEEVAFAATGMAAKSRVPVAFLLDHGVTYEGIVRAVHCGFSSIMYDGSTLPFEQNVENTKNVIKICKPLGITVEAELGHVGVAAIEGDSHMTDPEQAAQFVKETGIDALAVSIGNAHGKYRGVPKLDMKILADIRNRCDAPLVLHGGSGIPDDDFRESVRQGISKINIWTELSQVSADFVRELMKKEDAMLPDITMSLEAAAKKVALDRIDVFGSAGKA